MAEETEKRVETLEALESIYGDVSRASRLKEADHIHPLYRPFIEQAPFVVLATAGPDGLDASPRGDAPGFVHIEDSHTLLLPDRRGNNRIDSLRNIVSDPRVALIFLLPGIGETLRINGTAEILVQPELLSRFAVQDQLPKSVLRISVNAVYFQCSKAITRSGLWNPENHIERAALPTPGQILKALSQSEIDGEAYDEAMPARLAATLY
ncbi:pyridoxamine 5'-phosphate oxidase family protein [Pseudomonas sp. Marseille-QA0892]